MRTGLIGHAAAGCVILGLAGCGATTTADTTPTAAATTSSPTAQPTAKAAPTAKAPPTAKPAAMTVTGSYAPDPAAVGSQETFNVTLLHANQTFPNLTFDVNSDMSDHHVIDSVGAIISLQPDGAAPFVTRACPDAGSGNFTCGKIPKGASVFVNFDVIPKDAGNFSPGLQTFNDPLGSSDWQDITAADLSWSEVVNP